MARNPIQISDFFFHRWNCSWKPQSDILKKKSNSFEMCIKFCIYFKFNRRKKSSDCDLKKFHLTQNSLFAKYSWNTAKIYSHFMIGWKICFRFYTRKCVLAFMRNMENFETLLENNTSSIEWRLCLVYIWIWRIHENDRKYGTHSMNLQLRCVIPTKRINQCIRN